MELRNGLFSIGTFHLSLADFGNRLSNSFISYCFWDMLIDLCRVRNAYRDYTGKMESLTLTHSYIGRCHRDTSLTHNTDCERWNNFFILQIWWGWIIFNAFLDFSHTMSAFCAFLIHFLCSWFIWIESYQNPWIDYLYLQLIKSFLIRLICISLCNKR